jgi:hypothetical protein
MAYKAIAVIVVLGLSALLFATLQRSFARVDANRSVCSYLLAMEPSPRKLIGIALILLVIAVWATFVVSLARIVGSWPVLIQAPYYLVMGLAWIIPLKPLVRWIQTGSFRARSR